MTRFKNNSYLIQDRKVIKSYWNRVFPFFKIHTWKLYFVVEIGIFNAWRSFGKAWNTWFFFWVFLQVGFLTTLIEKSILKALLNLLGKCDLVSTAVLRIWKDTCLPYQPHFSPSVYFFVAMVVLCEQLRSKQ